MITVNKYIYVLIRPAQPNIKYLQTKTQHSYRNASCHAEHLEQTKNGQEQNNTLGYAFTSVYKNSTEWLHHNLDEIPFKASKCLKNIRRKDLVGRTWVTK